MQSESTIVIPLAEAGVEEVFDFTLVAKSRLMFVRLQDCPQPLRTYGRCVAYSAGEGEGPLAIGTMIRFPTIPHFIVAKRDLEVTVRSNRGFDANGPPETLPEKRQCVRPLREDGELVDDTGSRVKGTSTFVLDLDGVKHHTRNKTDLSLRERELAFLLRAMDSKRMEYSVAAVFPNCQYLFSKMTRTNFRRSWLSNRFSLDVLGKFDDLFRDFWNSRFSPCCRRHDVIFPCQLYPKIRVLF